MKPFLVSLSISFLLSFQLVAQDFNATTERKSQNYLRVKTELIHRYKNEKPGAFGESVKGVKKNIVTDQKILALTFDACGGKNGNGYDAELIRFLQKERIPATLFISGTWIDENKTLFLQLASDTLFEIENHGLQHRPCSVTKKRPYGIEATDSLGGAIDEMELNARKIEF